MKPSSIYIDVPPLIPLLLLSLERFAGELSVMLKVDTLHHYCTQEYIFYFSKFCYYYYYLLLLLLLLLLYYTLTVVLV